MYTEEYIENNIDKINWYNLTNTQKLSEDFIRKFKDKVNWFHISVNQKLSEDFIREFKDEINWIIISESQKLSENFIREFKDKVDWVYISYSQKLSEDFIREFQDKLNWKYISESQKLSENFIREFKDKIDWYIISKHQILSKNFIEKFQVKNNKELQLLTHYNKSSLQEKQELVKNYCDKYNLESDDNYLYAFRNHDMNNCGTWNKTISYKKNKYYRDWRCDLNLNEYNSFGYGIFPEGNTKVKVKIEDIGCWVNSNILRVLGFEII